MRRNHIGHSHPQLQVGEERIREWFASEILQKLIAAIESAHVEVMESAIALVSIVYTVLATCIDKIAKISQPDMLPSCRAQQASI